MLDAVVDGAATRSFDRIEVLGKRLPDDRPVFGMHAFHHLV